MPNNHDKLIVVSNRLPVTVAKDEAGDWKIASGSGGLVTALSPVLRNRGGKWIGWLGGEEVPPNLDELLVRGSAESGYQLLPVELTSGEIESYYNGFSNSMLWMLFHDFISLCNFEPANWPVYQQVNQKFAEAAAENSRKNDYIWVHDYHLLLVAAKLRAMNVHRRVGFFLHTPFPPLDVFLKMPWRADILNGMLEYDLLGFQTLRDLRNFLQCVRMLIPKAKVDGTRTVVTLRTPGRQLRVGAFPISIDFRDFVRRASRPEVAQEIEHINEHAADKKFMLGMDRLDYSKGIPLRLRAFRDALELYPDLRGKIVFLQIVIPSRLDGQRYQDLKDEIDRLIGSINGKYSESGWTPVNYLFRSLTDTELFAYYRRSDIALVTPLKDGMNLIAKEYCACSLDDNGVLILSEFAGAAAQMRDDALLVNPFDVRGVAAAIHEAFHMPLAERRERMRSLRRSVIRQNVFHWVDSFLEAAIARRIKDFPQAAEYVPSLYPTPARSA